MIEPSNAPQIDPMPPITTMMKRGIMTSAPMPGTIEVVGATKAPASAAKNAPVEKTAQYTTLTRVPSNCSISLSTAAARTTMPIRVRCMTYQSTPAVAKPAQSRKKL